MIKNFLYEYFVSRKISFKLMILTLLFSAVITAIITMIQLYMDYKNGMKSIDRQFSLVQSGYMASINQSIWVYDREQIALQLEGILNLPDIKYVAINLEDGGKFEEGEKPDKNFLAKKIPLTYMHNGNKIHMGELLITADLNKLYDELIDKVIVVLASQAVKTFLTSFFILFLFQRLVTTHLETIARFTKNLSVNKKPEELILEKLSSKETRDELDNLTEAINMMQNQIYQSYLNVLSELEGRKKAENKIQEQSVFYQSILDGIKEPLMVIDKDYNVVILNKAAEEHKVIQNIHDVQHPKCYEISHKQSHPCDGTGHPCPLHKVMETKGPVTMMHNHPDVNGESHFVELTATPLYDKSGTFIGIVESTKDITSEIRTRKELEEYKDKLEYEEHYNTLTGLPNRILFYDRVDQATKYAIRDDKKYAILYVDINNFKSINDSFGIDMGNETLKALAEILKEHARESDSVAHFGADEFGLILNSIKDTNVVIDYVEKLKNIFKDPLQIKNEKLYITVSMGISIYPTDSEDSDDLIKYADIALHKAKRIGKDNYEFYTGDLTQIAYERIVLENSLREAIYNGELVPYYQPKVDAVSEQIIGMEALVRWKHKSLGLIPPIKFITIAEEIKIIADIDLFMLDSATKAISRWYQEGLNPGVVSVNVSLDTLKSTNFAQRVADILQTNKCKAEYLELEITESQIMDDPNKIIAILNEIKQLGIKFSIDDFGTGYSSLAYLKKLPIDKLKIDKTFVDEIPNNEDDVTIIKTIIALSKSLKLDVIAEGVETKEQKDFLLDNGCRLIQGYFYSKPLNEEDILNVLKFGLDPLSKPVS